MNIQFLLFQNEGEKPSHSIMFDLPGVPQSGDLVTITRPDQEGSSNFIVRRIVWGLDYPESISPQRVGQPTIGKTASITVECTYALGSYASEEHK